jgi:hypothetical protein
MPARKRPTPEDTVTARQTLLDGLARDAGIFELVSELAPLHPRDNTFPGEVFLHLAADALDWCGASRSGPLALEGLREQFLPECTFRGRQNKKFQYAVLAAAALHGGTEPDLLDEVAWWQADDFLAVRPVRGGRLHPRRREPGGRAGASGMSGPGRTLWPPSAITTSSGGCGSGHLTAGRPIITAIVRHVGSGGHTGHRAARRWRASQAWPMRCLPLPVAGARGARDRTWAAWTLAGSSLLPRCGRDGPGREVA